MKKPASTYRLQLSPTFKFTDLNKIIDYLNALGVSTIYSAPFFQAREGSTHGYDVLDPFTLNREIGKLEDFRVIRERMREKNMTWLQDIVPNHMAYDGSNPWLKDIFEIGPKSRFYNFFDINWEYKGWGKVMAPFLGAPLEEVLANNDLEIKFDSDGFSLNYYDNKYPLSARSYQLIFSSSEFENWKTKFEDVYEKEAAFKDLKTALFTETESDSRLYNILQQRLKEINSSREKLQEILDLQFYKPAYWKETEKEINYRRFFTINDLICLKMEDQNVFDTYHYYIKELCDAGLINGLRIDHIDGLFDPEGYLHKLRELVGEDFYIVVEKILEAEEKLPVHWPTEGTSGYEFLAQVNHLLTDASGEENFQKEYKNIYPEMPHYEDLVYEKKLFILKERMAGELHNLWLLLKEEDLLPEGNNAGEKQYKQALGAFLAAFPVYRIYPHTFPLTKGQTQLIEAAFKRALEKQPDSKKELHNLKALITGETDKNLERALYFLQRCQQFSGPLAAKGVEDTSFYIYNRLVSHNEVGDSPENFGISVEEFHQKMQERKSNFPHAINSTATHDTKRGEDARMRLNVLSEISKEWFGKVDEWSSLNKAVKKQKNIPDPNEEYFIYQILLAAMPFQEEEDFLSRTKDSLQKGFREAKVHTNWGQPDENFEQGIFDFVTDILDNQEFRNSFDPFFKKVAAYGAIKSLSQSLIKLTAPGIPDVYQGTELWDLSYVDPDNRRPVDYDLRKQYISEFQGYNTDNLKDNISSLKKDYKSAKFKMYTTFTALKERRNEPDLFLEGKYIPLQIKGKHSEKLIGFARRENENWSITIAPVLVTELFDKVALSLKTEKVEKTSLILPENAPKKWVNVLTGETINCNGEIKVADVLSLFPVALLKNKPE